MPIFREILHIFTKSHFALLAWRIVLLYIVLAICRAVFWWYNYPIIGAISYDECKMLIIGALRFDTVSILYANCLLIVLSLIPLHLREGGGWQTMLYYIYVIINALLIVVINLADAVYFRYTQKRFTSDEILFADNDNSISLIFKFLGENLPLFFIGIALIALIAWAGRRKARPEPFLANQPAYYLGGTVQLTLVVLLSVAGMRGGFTRMTRPIAMSNATRYATDSGKANLLLSNPFCILRTAGKNGRIKYEHYFDDTTLNSIYSPVHQADSTTLSPMKGLLHGRNIMVFVMESMSAEHSAYLMPELYENEQVKGYTPFLDSLMRLGYCFERMYANGTRSIQALPAVLGSIPSFKTPFILMPQALAPTRKLPRIMRDNGYSTAFFCGSHSGSMGFDAYAHSAGITQFFSREDYEKSHGTNDFDNYWGIWDEPFLQYTGEVLGDAAQLPEPFFATLFTLTSHHPFVVPEEYRDRLPQGHTLNHKCVAYTDNAFRLFFKRYAGEKWFQNTAFVFVADHVSSEKFADATRAFPENHHIIGFIYTPDGALRGSSAEPVSQIDLMPTLLGLMGNTEPYFAFGRDIFDEPTVEPFVLCYDNGFEAVTADRIAFFDEHRITGIYDRNDYKREHPLAGTEADNALTMRIKAFIQQYYSRMENKNFMVE